MDEDFGVVPIGEFMDAKEQYQRLKEIALNADRKAKKANNDWLALGRQSNPDGTELHRLSRLREDLEKEANEAQDRVNDFAKRNNIDITE